MRKSTRILLVVLGLVALHLILQFHVWTHPQPNQYYDHQHSWKQDFFVPSHRPKQEEEGQDKLILQPSLGATLLQEGSEDKWQLFANFYQQQQQSRGKQPPPKKQSVPNQNQEELPIVKHYYQQQKQHSSSTTRTTRTSDGHPVAGLSCQAHGGPNDQTGSRSESQAVQDMVYWYDWPTDATWHSPHAPPTDSHQPQKYLTFEPDEGGFNNIRMAFETALVMAMGMGRILVLPPEMNFYLLTNFSAGDFHASFGFKDFFDLSAIVKEHERAASSSQKAAALQVMSMEGFLQREALTGHLVDRTTGQPSFPPGNLTQWKGRIPPNFLAFLTRAHNNNGTDSDNDNLAANTNASSSLWKWLRRVTANPEWQLSKCVAVIPRAPGRQALEEIQHEVWEPLVQKDETRRQKLPELLRNRTNLVWRSRFHFFDKNPAAVNASAVDRLSQVLAHRQGLCLYNETLQEARVVHLQGEQKAGYRLLIPFYAAVLFQEWQHDVWMKRFVRDHLRYHDDIQCAAARIVHAVREKARIVNRQLANATQGNKKDEEDVSFHSMHIRRGDFQFKVVRNMEVEDIDESNIRKWFTPGKVVYIATDERNKTFFDPLREHYELVFLDDFIELLSGVDSHYYGMIEQLVAAQGNVFVGSLFSTFTGYIHRLRGYHSHKRQWPGYEMGALPTSYYFTPNPMAHKRKVMHEYHALEPAFWQREFPMAWRDLDHGLVH